MEKEKDGHNVAHPSGASFTAEELLEAAKKSLQVEFREDGPPLGFEFDPIPTERRLSVEERAKAKRMVMGEYHGQPPGDNGIQDIRRGIYGPLKPFHIDQLDPSNRIDQRTSVLVGMDGHPLSGREIEREQRRVERQRQKEQERVNREHQRELDRQQKEHDKQLRLQQKEEEKRKAQLERDIKKLERNMEKERRAEEKKRQQEEKKREKDMQKALAAQLRIAQREIQKKLEAGPPDDLELEIDMLKSEELKEAPSIPPSSLQLEAAFPTLGDRVGGDVVMLWGFVQSFCDIIAVPPFSIKDFIAALEAGQKSKLLSTVHMVLIRLIQADMEESHHLVLTQGSGGTSNFMDRAVVRVASTLDEAVSRGFDVDAWRAHLNQFTWPEVLRQIGISAGYGPRCPRGYRTTEEGEDVSVDEHKAGYGLKMPSRLTQGTVKAAAWQVLSEVGPEGLTISEIASRIQKQGLRDLRTTKTPEATVAGALSRDAVFCRVAPATYALHVVLPSADNQSRHSSAVEDLSVKDEDNESADMEIDEAANGESWIKILSNGDYSHLSVEDRVEALKTLCTIALESPTIRACLESRLEKEIQEQKKLDIEARAEKKARREKAAEETQIRLMDAGMEGEDLDSTVRSMMTESMLSTPINASAGSNSDPIKAQEHVRFEPLGRDRHYNRYWKFNEREASHLFVELEGRFLVVRSKDELDQIMNALECRGAREGLLHFHLNNYVNSLEGDRQQWSDQWKEDRGDEQTNVDGLFLFATKWIEFGGQRDWLTRLKICLASTEEALRQRDDWKPIEGWSEALETAGSLDEVIKCMGQLEFSLDADLIHSSYKRNPQIVYGAWSDSYNPDTIGTPDGFLNWLPESLAAAFLHLLKLDAALVYKPGTVVGRKSLLQYKYVQKPFVRELNPHVDAVNVDLSSKDYNQFVSLEPVGLGGKVVASAFPVLQKGSPVQKQHVAFYLPVEEYRQAVEEAEKNGTLYANIQPSKGKWSRKGERKTIKIKTLRSEEDASASLVGGSSEDHTHSIHEDSDTMNRSDTSRDEAYNV